MKLCYIANSRFPSERAHMTQIVQMCNAFAQHGHEVTLMVTDRKTSITESPEDFFGVPLAFTVERIPVPDIAGKAHRIPVPLRPFAFLIQRVVFAYRSARTIRKHGIEHVYGRDEWVLLMLTYLLKVPITWESHEAKFSWVARLLIARTVSLVVISEGIRDFYVRHGIAAGNIIVAHDAVDERFFEPHITRVEARQLLGIQTALPVVMYIGGLDLWKGVDTLFAAASKQDIFALYVVGGKDREIAEKQRAYPHVHFLGQRPYKDLPRIQQAADVLVVPNTARNALSAEYTSPLKLFAHMTAKKPIVASRIPSIMNVVTEGEVWFAEPDNPESLHRAISDALTETTASQAKAIAAYTKSKNFTWNQRANLVV